MDQNRLEHILGDYQCMSYNSTSMHIPGDYLIHGEEIMLLNTQEINHRALEKHNLQLFTRDALCNLQHSWASKIRLGFHGIRSNSQKLYPLYNTFTSFG